MSHWTSISAKVSCAIIVKQGYTLNTVIIITDANDCLKPWHNLMLTILLYLCIWNEYCSFVPMWDLFGTFGIRLVPYEILNVTAYAVLPWGHDAPIAYLWKSCPFSKNSVPKAVLLWHHNHLVAFLYFVCFFPSPIMHLLKSLCTFASSWTCKGPQNMTCVSLYSLWRTLSIFVPLLKLYDPF